MTNEADMSWKQRKSVSDNDAFVTLVRVAQDDPKIRATLGVILGQTPFHRKSLLNSLIQNIAAQGAPENLTLAMAELLNDSVADQVARAIAK